jgi:outer membrane protein assembly factor BamB
MKTNFKLFPSYLISSIAYSFIMLFLLACGKDKIKDPSKEILTLDILKADSTIFNKLDVSIILEQDTVWVILPPGADLANIKPIVTFKGKTIAPLSGKTINFTNPVVFTITADDGTTRNYVVVVKAHEVNKIYAGDTGGRMVCYDAKTGAERWIKTLAAPAGFGYSQAVLKNNTIYVGGSDWKVYALNSMTGEVKWSFLTGQVIEGSPLVENGMVYVGSVDDKLYALDAETNSLKWSYETYANVSGKPVFDNGRIYFASSDGIVYAVDAMTGALIWRFYSLLHDALYASGSPVLYKGIIYIGSRYGNLFAINAINGTMKWVFNDGNISMEQATPVIKNDSLFFSSSFQAGTSPLKLGALYAINANTGALIWKTQEGIGFFKAPVYHDGKLYIPGYDDKLKAIRSNDGSVIWEVANFRGLAPTFANNLLFLGENINQRFCAINPENGSIVWQRTGGHYIFSKPLVVDNRGRVID